VARGRIGGVRWDERWTEEQISEFMRRSGMGRCVPGLPSPLLSSHISNRAHAQYARSSFEITRRKLEQPSGDFPEPVMPMYILLKPSLNECAPHSHTKALVDPLSPTRRSIRGVGWEERRAEEWIDEGAYPVKVPSLRYPHKWIFNSARAHYSPISLDVNRSEIGTT
jgi:hypothetical protein